MVDNNLPPVLGRGLSALFNGRHEVIHIKDKFGRGNLPDEEWIKVLGAEGKWSILSGDTRIASKRPSREIFLSNNLVGFFPAPAVMKLDLAKQASRILYLWDVMDQQSKIVSRGCFQLPMTSQTLRQIG
jgi:PIN like domain